MGSAKKGSCSRVPVVPLASQKMMTSTVQVRPTFPFISSQFLVSLAPQVTPMFAQVPTTLTLAHVRMPVESQVASLKAPFSLHIPNVVFPATFFPQIFATTLVSCRLGFKESTPPPNVGATSIDPFFLGVPPFVPLFSLATLAQPIQTSFGGPISSFPYAFPTSLAFAGQAISTPDTYDQQVTYSKNARLNQAHKRKEKDGLRPVRLHVQTHFSEENDSLFFKTVFPKVNEPEAQMKPDDYSLHAFGVDLTNATAMDKVEMMEETSKAVSLDFIKKSCHLDKMQVDLSHLRESSKRQRKENKARSAEINCL